MGVWSPSEGCGSIYPLPSEALYGSPLLGCVCVCVQAIFPQRWLQFRGAGAGCVHLHPEASLQQPSGSRRGSAHAQRRDPAPGAQEKAGAACCCGCQMGSPQTRWSPRRGCLLWRSLCQGSAQREGEACWQMAVGAMCLCALSVRSQSWGAGLGEGGFCGDIEGRVYGGICSMGVSHPEPQSQASLAGHPDPQYWGSIC